MDTSELHDSGDVTPTGGSVVRRNDERQRYELHVDGTLVSFADFSERPDAIVVPHVETDPRFRGRGHSSTLMAGVVDDLKARSIKIVPHCPFARSFVEALPDADELITV
ncbi:MAG: GNAT family N-acetyltransferase [Ilumatobacteraceae bacterium]